MEEIPSFREDVARIYRQMLLCQETEKIDKKMREEIIPEMLKNVSSMKNMRFGFEESDEENNDMNPDWEDAFEKSGLGDKLREMNELQLEGADVYMSTFAALKNYPFFRELGLVNEPIVDPVLAALWGTTQPPKENVFAVLGRAILGKMILGRNE